MKTWIITGAGHFPGIGACLAQHILEQGNRVAINSRSMVNIKEIAQTFKVYMISCLIIKHF